MIDIIEKNQHFNMKKCDTIVSPILVATMHPVAYWNVV